MEKTSTMKQARTSVLVALALICVVSCAKIDDESSAVAPEQPVRSAANAANASLPRPRAAAPGATL